MNANFKKPSDWIYAFGGLMWFVVMIVIVYAVANESPAWL